MMDLQISVVLLFIFLTGGHSLKCYTCTSVQTNCEAKVETCEDGFSKCESITVEQAAGFSTLSVKTKQCAVSCENGSHRVPTGKITTRCCDTDLCNGADGAYKGSFLLLSSPLLFYFLFQ
ncbi:prostate stem cell antigen-like [Puntigrus tetrazona]|uniref:prostate stem cell antigen-like n=1 Tax=Puntigrus tetrazona TaxID=1606681 RepID=UPI001C8A5BDB|nr:prostate stem cell antigen-like [Puntigrus tetrazona]